MNDQVLENEIDTHYYALHSSLKAALETALHKEESLQKARDVLSTSEQQVPATVVSIVTDCTSKYNAKVEAIDNLRVELGEVKERIKSYDKRERDALRAGATPIDIIKRHHRMHLAANRPVTDAKGNKKHVSIAQSALGIIRDGRNSALVQRRRLINLIAELEKDIS
jgi:hypothetical protein